MRSMTIDVKGCTLSGAKEFEFFVLSRDNRSATACARWCVSFILSA